MLRINLDGKSMGVTTMRLEGRLVDRWVEELDRLCAEVRRTADTLTIDVTGVSYLDPQAIRLLQTLRKNGIRVEGGSPFVRELLEGDEHDAR